MSRRKRKAESDDESSYSEKGESNNDSKDQKDEKGGHQDECNPAGDDDWNDDSKESTDHNRRKSNPVSKPKKKRKKKSYDTVSPEDFLSSAERKTKYGGYAHTNESKSKISQANTGNTPWNKGKNRSSADRAKIAAGVRARNRAILLQKLKRLGMSEEEWETKRREIKYLRERIRRAKSSKKKHDSSEAERKLRAIDAERKLQAAIEATTLEPSSLVAEGLVGDEDRVSDVVEEVFSKDVEWTPFSFGEHGETYDKTCPRGGPGGLVCCEDCAAKYTLYVSGTVKDIEKHRVSRNGNEVKELLKFLKQKQEVLENAYNVAKKKIPPLPPKLAPPKVVPEPATTSRRAGTGPTVPTQWNMTSTFDIEHGKGTLTPI